MIRKVLMLAFKVSIILCSYRFICLFFDIRFGYYINDITFFLVFGLGMFYFKYKERRISYIKSFAIFGLTQILLSSFLYEVIKIILFKPELDQFYWSTRIAVFLAILATGLLANFLFLLAHFFLFKSDRPHKPEDENLLDND